MITGHQFQNIPDELKRCWQWVCWRLIPSTKRGRYKKVPFNTLTGRKASVTNPNDWCSFEDAVRLSRNFNGIGFVFTENDPYCGIDLDKRNELTQWVFDNFISYTEYSFSGNGLHIIILGRIPNGINQSEEKGN